MKNLILAVLFVLFTGSVASAVSIKAQFSDMPNPTYRYVLIYGTESGVDASGNVSNIGLYKNGQVGDIGVNSVDAGGFLWGTTYYFTCYMIDKDGNKSDGYCPEYKFTFPAESTYTQVTPLPPIEIEALKSQDITIQIKIITSP